MSGGNEVRCLAFTEEGRENLSVVHKLTVEKGLKCVWVTPEGTASISKFEEEVAYVVDPIEGNDEIEDIIHKLLSLKYPVLGPQCVLTQLKHGIRLRADIKYPVCTLTMLGTVVCFSNVLHEEREKLIRMVELMGGKVTKPLDESVTHLVTGEVGSVKYFAAASCNKKIMTRDWIYHLWKAGNSRYVCAKDGEWEGFLCPIFLGCSICMTGFGNTEKTKVQKLATKFGGEYSGAMKLNITTHLIVSKPEGQKYNMAEKFGVKVVNLDWFYDSIEKGSCQDNINYPVKPLEHSVEPNPSLHQSTPEVSARFTSLVDVSSIDPSTINETVASNMNDTAMSSFATMAKSANRLLTFPISSSYADVLDGIHVFIVGFSFQEEEKIGKLLSLAGAIKHTKLSSNVDRVVVGDASRVDGLTKNSILTASSENPELNVVGQNWVLDSLSSGKVVPEKDYWQSSILPCDYEDTRAHAEMMSCDESTINQLPTVKKVKPVKNSNMGHDGSVLGFLLPDDDDNTVLSQYMNQNGGDDITETKLFFQHDGRNESDMETTCHQPEDTTTLHSMTKDTDMTANGCFSGKLFYVLGFVGEGMVNLISDIETNGGTILAADSKKIADYAVVPLTGWLLDKTTDEVVTIFWVKLCITSDCIIDLTEHQMCAPFSVSPDSLPLKGCVACLSQYRDLERIYLTQLIKELGGIVQEIVAKKDGTTIKKTSHLIIHEPGGDKYKGCKLWGIPVVNENWVYECARKGKKVKEEDFVVGETVDNSHTSDVKNEQSSNVRSSSVSSVPVREKRVHSYTGWDSEFPPMPRAPSVVNKIRERLEAQTDMKKKALEEAIKNKETPIGVRYKRLRLETPSRFMNKAGTPGNISFDLTEVFQLLKTPVEQQKKLCDEVKKNPDTPMSEVISRWLDECVSNIPEHLIQNLESKLSGMETGECAKDNSPSSEKENVSKIDQKASNIFDNLVISLATKLHKDYSELAKIITAHGGEFRWTYDNACTHFLFQGRLNDKNKEFCTAKKDGKIIVTPYWIEACILAESRLEESMFPHVYDPNKSIQVSRRSQRTTRRSQEMQKSRVSTRGSTSGTSSASDSGDTPKSKRMKPNKPEDSQEGREILKKKLENIIADTAVARDHQVHRLSCGVSTISSPAQRRHSTVANATETKLKPELSQDVQVSWDDPTGRQEMLRLMSKTSEDGNNITAMETTNEDTDVTELKHGKIPSEMFFLMSSVSSQDKSRLAGIINELGAHFLDSNFLDPKGTHLLVSKPGRSEKYLSALASGKYILRPGYLDECQKSGTFVSEECYEYGNPENPETKQFMQNPESFQSLIPLAAHRWRTKLERIQQESGTRQGAFSGWKVVLLVNDKQRKGFERLLKSGMATIEESSVSQLHEARDITHVFADQERAKALDITLVEDLVSRTGAHFCDQNFIGDYLLKDPIPIPSDYYIPQAVTALKMKDDKSS